MQEQGPRLKASEQGDVMVIELTDQKILDEINITQLGEQLQAMVQQASHSKFVMDFSSVAHMSSSALGMLITLQKKIREKGGQLRLCNIQPTIHEVFVITRLNEIFNIHPSRKEAVESLA
ncbi:MAG: STAS domain-containing protein [Planctomycetota bacterium]|nr:STAS domain-containing protein [Planctomycetota bacterium]